MIKFLTGLVVVIMVAISVSGCVLPQQTIELKIGEAKPIQIITQKTSIELERVDVANQTAFFSVYNPDNKESSRYSFSVKLGETKNIMNTYNEYVGVRLDNINNEGVTIYLSQGKPSGEGMP